MTGAAPSIVHSDKVHSDKTLVRSLTNLQARVNAACERSQRPPQAITLIAITKTLSPASIRAAYRAGLRDFGENRIEEASAKLPALRAALPEARWHMVGHVQSRKAAHCPLLFDCLHSVDSLKLARRLGRFANEAGRTLPILAQCNISGEAQKSGFPAQNWHQQSTNWKQLRADFAELARLPGLELRGLMTMAPNLPQAEATRPHFASLAALRIALREALSLPLPDLSMGMTNDFEIAIEEGATLIRIGRALFGER